eukprot:365084-Chlamydomonas_euryale.AAC.27
MLSALPRLWDMLGAVAQATAPLQVGATCSAPTLQGTVQCLAQCLATVALQHTVPQLAPVANWCHPVAPGGNCGATPQHRRGAVLPSSAIVRLPVVSNIAAEGMASYTSMPVCCVASI